MKKLTKCLACGSKHLYPVIDLGEQPLANAYSSFERYPLAMNYCERCFHAQLTYSIDPELLFTNYAYVSGTTKTLDDWFKGFAKRFKDQSKGRILDVAGNDGSLLKHFKNMGWSVLNVDPAKNLQHFNSELGIPMVNRFFDEKLIKRYGRFDVVTAFNVLAHTPDPITLLKGIKAALLPDGEAYIMTSQADMLTSGQFDTIYHEHHSFFTENSMRVLLSRVFHGYEFTFSREPIHGGSMMVKIKRPYTDFIYKAIETMDFLREIPSPKIGYGAAAKATVMINSSKISLSFVVDENPLKQGKTVPGTNIHIFAPEILQKTENNLNIIIFAWNFAPEIMKKIKKLRPNNKDTFYIPFPTPRVVK